MPEPLPDPAGTAPVPRPPPLGVRAWPSPGSWPPNSQAVRAPVVSVLLPARDAAAFLPAALDSALGQSFGDLEVLLVDDGSTDATWAMALEAAAHDRRVRPLRCATPRGPAAARNTALAAATGRWVALLDADDLWLPGRLARLVPQAEALHADLLADDLLLRDSETGAALGRHLGPAAIAALDQPLTLAGLLRADMPDAPPGGPGAIGYAKPLIRRAFLQRGRLRYDESLTVSEDLAFFAACIAAGGRFRVVEDALYVYRLRRHSASRRRGIAAMQARANRSIARMAARQGDEAARALCARRQDLLDRAAVADAAASGRWLRALGAARWGRPATLARDLRVVAGAARRRLVA